MFSLVSESRAPRWVIIIIDLFLSALGLIFAYLIRFDLSADARLINSEWAILAPALPVFFITKYWVFKYFKIHKGMIRHTSTEDMKRVLFASAVSSAIFLILGIGRRFWLDGYFLFPLSVLMIEFLGSFFLLIGSRFTVKLLYLESIKSNDSKERILIYGAGISGLITKRTIEKDIRVPLKVIGFLDDNKKIDGTRLEGKGIFHSSKLKTLIEDEGITQVIIAIQNPDKVNRQHIVEICLRYGVVVKTVPSPKSWINGEFSTKQMGRIKIEDLLGRKPIVLNEEAVKNQIQNKVILVTGAAGSIGSGLVKQILEHKPKMVLLLDQSESPLYDFHIDLLAAEIGVPVEPIVGDIRNRERMRRLFEHFKPELVFHAAAYKHVPMMENNPSEAVYTNILGTKNLVDCAQEFGVSHFVMISTDKAVNPTNVMGASKRIAEMYAQKANEENKCKFITTRFGNVLGSNGSVIPLFQKQIAQGGPITLTDANITRYFMTIPEACQLVLEAGSMGQGGEIFVFDMGESVKIIDLAKKMIQLNGLELGRDIEIKITGLRPGEKLYEELLAKDEGTLTTHHPQILIAKIRPAGEELKKQIEGLIASFGGQNNQITVAMMKKIVPEFVSNNSEFENLDNK
ncbi:MAG: FlaA1/EpsC-like NDP-sugar epimerase [Psychromonas sp.]|jgi:FlaA1/EpsC-like NDP-sugar epimerase